MASPSCSLTDAHVPVPAYLSSLSLSPNLAASSCDLYMPSAQSAASPITYTPTPLPLVSSALMNASLAQSLATPALTQLASHAPPCSYAVSPRLSSVPIIHTSSVSTIPTPPILSPCHTPEPHCPPAPSPHPVSSVLALSHSQVVESTLSSLSVPLSSDQSTPMHTMPEHLVRLVRELYSFVRPCSADRGTQTDGTNHEVSDRSSQTAWQLI